MKFNFDEIVKNRQKYAIQFGRNDMLVRAILEGNYNSEFAMLPPEMLQKEVNHLLKNRFIDAIIRIPSPFAGMAIDFYIVHFSSQKPKKFLTGIYKGNIFEKRFRISSYDIKSAWMIKGEYTEDFKAMIAEINMFFENKEITRDDLNVNDYKEFNMENLNPLYYTKQAIKVRKELQENDYKLLTDFADILTNPEEKNIKAKYIDSTNMTYPFVYSNLKEAEIKRAIKVKKGDIVCLLVGKQPQFYLYNEKYNDIYIKAGNYCLLRCKEAKYSSYLVNYLKDEKARLYFSSTVHGGYIPHLTKSDLMNLKIIIPDEHMLEIANETQNYLMNQKKLSPYEINELIRNSYNVKYKKESHKMICNDIISLISNIKINALKELINNDLNEVEICFNNGAYKSAIILCGSILEAVLLDWLSEYENTDNIFNIAISKGGKDLALIKIIDKLEEVVKPRWYEASKAHEIRITRNMVHPKEYIKNNRKVTCEECKKIIDDLKDIIESKEKRHKIG